ncbi:hypothetical protein ABE67_17915 [Cytobacillus firmus]|uniref:hypothetical protein n=1 Tax=Cytobacillus firmus TaxID=1399 RepID=UPI0018CEC2C0|nr:hypothetical protein [Cytobacillus firmus]MBG9447501.1 hypothetical protein [Cytobacillus firmus]MBG9451130.1 hypothetical protein [Cytobacillus firmus]
MDPLKDSHANLINLLVASTLKKHGVKKRSLSSKERKEIRYIVRNLHKQAQELLDTNIQKTVTENDVKSKKLFKKGKS